MMNEEEIRAVVLEVLSGLGIEKPESKDKGRIMKELMPKVKGKAGRKAGQRNRCFHDAVDRSRY